jgi:hypothetical protein
MSLKGFENIRRDLGRQAASERECAAKNFRKHAPSYCSHHQSPPRLATVFSSHPHSLAAVGSFHKPLTQAYVQYIYVLIYMEMRGGSKPLNNFSRKISEALAG